MGVCYDGYNFGVIDTCDRILDRLKKKAYFLDDSDHHHAMTVVDLDDIVEVINDERCREVEYYVGITD